MKKINKFMLIGIICVITGLSVVNSLTGHGIRNNPFLNALVLGTGNTGSVSGSDGSTAPESDCYSRAVGPAIVPPPSTYHYYSTLTFECSTGAFGSCLAGTSTRITSRSTRKEIASSPKINKGYAHCN